MDKKYNCQVNPKRSTIDFQSFREKAIAAKQSEEFRRELPFQNYSFSEINFFEFKVHSEKEGTLKLTTYREKQQNEDDPIKGILFLVPGLGSYVQRYSHIAKEFSKQGFVCVGYGVAKSEGTQGYIENHHVLVQDFITFTLQIDQIYDKKIPRFFLGQSMGGMIGILFGIKIPNYFKGQVLFAPAIKDFPNLYLGKKLMRILNYIVPKLQTKKPTGNEGCKNPVLRENIFADENIYKEGIRPATVSSLLNGMEETHQNLKKYSVPFVVVQGGIDKLVDLEGAFDLYDQASVQDKTLLFYETAWHGISQEEEIYDILGRVVEWVKQRCS